MKLKLLFIVISLLTISCGKNQRKQSSHIQNRINNNHLFFEKAEKLKAYYSDGDVKSEILNKCLYVRDKDKSCKFKDLSPIGADGKPITVRKILQRTMIKHTEFGYTFKNLLESFKSEELFKLFGAASSIVISEHINPSFYSPVTGTIYLSASYIWLGPNAKKGKKKSNAKDNRGKNLGDVDKRVLKFDYFTQQLIGEKSIRAHYAKEKKTLNDIAPNLFRVLVHELTHANDFMPKSQYTKIKDKELTFAQSALSRFKGYLLVSDSLSERSDDPTLIEYARIVYSNIKVTKNILDLTAEEFVQLFTRELATDTYAFDSKEEDIAMMMEDLIGLADMGIEKRQAVITYPHNHYEIPEDHKYNIVWGQKNRILEPQILNRGLDIMKKILPETDQEKFKEKLKSYKLEEIPAGSTWFE